MKEVTSTELRENLSDILKQVQYTDERVKVTSHGKTRAYLVSEDELKRLHDAYSRLGSLMVDVEEMPNELRQMVSDNIEELLITDE